MKYVITNCPAIKEITTLLTSEPPQFQKEWCCCTTGSNLKKCKNCTDCVMKRIVEKLKPLQIITFEHGVKGMFTTEVKVELKQVSEILERLGMEEVDE